MSHPLDYIQLYSTILFHDVRRHSLSDETMKAAITSIEKVYKPESESLWSTGRRPRPADYNSRAYRCAYLHKYAPFHTVMAHDIMKCILQENDNMFSTFQKRFSKRQQFKICSLGGGPGSDTVGVLIAMFEHFDLFPCTACVIDIKSEWVDTLSSVIDGLGAGVCGPVGECFTQPYFNWEYLTADLLEEMRDDVKSAIGSADLVTMVKFVSAAACESTEWMLRKIFTMLKLGALVLFIDNSSGGYREVVSKAANDCNLTSLFGPIKYSGYTNEDFKITHWGRTSCYSTTATIHMLKKLRLSPPFINVPSKQIVKSAPKSNNELSSINNNDQSMKRSDVEAENVTLQAKLKEIQEKNLKDRNEFIAKIAALKKTVSTNRDRIKILTETIQILEKYKADVADYEVQIVSAKEEIDNLKKDLENAKILQEQSDQLCQAQVKCECLDFIEVNPLQSPDITTEEEVDLKKQILERQTRLEKEKTNIIAELEKALRERQIQIKELDVKMTEQITARKEDFALIEQLQHEKKLSETEISQLKMELQQANAKIKEYDDESVVSPKRRRILRSKQSKVVEPLNDSKTASKVELTPPKARTRRKVQESEIMSRLKRQAVQYVGFKRRSVAQSVSNMPSSRVTRGSKKFCDSYAGTK